SFPPECTDQIEAAHEPRRSEPKDGSGYDRNGQSEPQHTPVNRYLVHVREGLGNQVQQELLGEEQNRKTGDPAEQEEQQTLGEELADEARSLRSQSLANRDLTTSHTGPGEQQIGDVDATDQENQSHRAEQQNERLTNAADYGFAKRNEARGPRRLRRIVRRILFFQRFNQRIEVRLRGRNREI